MADHKSQQVEATDATQPVAWSGGRVLTEAQRARKREINRVTQRLQRHRRREVRIAKLELELAKLRDTADVQNDGDETSPEPDPSMALDADTWVSSWVDLPLHLAPTHDVPTPVPASNDPAGHLDSNVDPGLPLSSEVPSAALSFSMRKFDGRDMTETMNSGIRVAVAADSQYISLDTRYNESVLAHSILLGWDKLCIVHNVTCPVILALRYLDDVVFRPSHAGPMERLTMMHCIYRQLLVCHSLAGSATRMLTFAQSRRFASLNNRQRPWLWHHPRPSQLMLQHDEIVDYVVW